jgi:hypothetical protein
MIKQAISVRKQTIHFHDNGYYKIEREILFKPPNSTKNAFHIYNSNIALLNKLQKEFHCPRAQGFREFTFHFYDMLPQRF